MRFDARAAKLLAPGEHIMVDGCPGLRLVASQSRRSWVYRYKSPVDDKMRQVRIGQWPALSPAGAIVEWERLRAERDAGGDPAAARRAVRAAAAAPRAAGYTVRQLCDDYLAGHVDAHRKPKGAKEVRRMLATMLSDLAAQQAAMVTRQQAFALLEAHAHIPVQASYLRGELGAAWDLALDAGRLPQDTPNWWRLIMRGRLRSRGKKIAGESIGAVKRVLSDAETGALINWLPNFSKTVCDALTLYLWTGTRGAEIMAMEASEIRDEPDGLWWTVPKAKTKNARHASATDLRVPLLGRAETVVRRRLAQSHGYLFKSAAVLGHVEQKTVQTAVHYHQPYSTTNPDVERPRLTVTRWSPHDLRRTVRTLLATMGCPNEVAESILGHMQPGVQGIYNRHAYDKERRVWLKKLSTRLESLAKTA